MKHCIVLLVAKLEEESYRSGVTECLCTEVERSPLGYKFRLNVTEDVLKSFLSMSIS